MAIYDAGTASLAADGTVTGVGTTWRQPLTLIRVGATMIFNTTPASIVTIAEILSDTEIRVFNDKGFTAPAGTQYSILAHDGITVQGLAQDVAETLRYYQSRETEVAEAVDAFNQFDANAFQQSVTNVNNQSQQVASDAAQVSSDKGQVSADKESAAASAASALADKNAAAASAAAAADSAASLDTSNLLRVDRSLSDLTDKVLSRENLDVYSKAETKGYDDPLTTFTLGGTRLFKEGVYNPTSALVLDYLNYDAAFIGSKGVRANYSGENMAETIINSPSGSTDFTIIMQGDPSGASQRIHAYDRLANLTIKGNSTSYGIRINNKAYTKLENIVSFDHSNGEGLRTNGILTSIIDNVYLQNNRVGWRVLDTPSFSLLNGITINRLTVSQNTHWGILGDSWGAGTTINSMTCEQNGTQGNADTGGIYLNVSSLNGSGALVLNNPYFEGNGGVADLSIDNVSSGPVTIVINGGNFNRVSSSKHVTYNIRATSSGGGELTVILNGTTFQSAGDYVPSTIRPFWSVGDNCKIFDNSCVFTELTSKGVARASGGTPMSGVISSSGSIVSGVGISSINLPDSGIYDITFSKDLASSSDGYAVLLTPRNAGDSVACDFVPLSANSFRAIFRNTISGAGFATGFSYLIVRLA